MMESRLLLAKKLLNPKNSVMIVTIDEKEYLHLGCLLEEMFPEANIQMVSSVINPKGSVKKGLLTRCDEYIYYVYLGEGHVCTVEDDFLFLNNKKEKVRWPSLKRTGTNSMRGIYKSNAFYPLYYDEETGNFVKIGENIASDVPIGSVPVPKGLRAVWPIDNLGIERIWQLYPESFEKLSKLGYIDYGKLKNGTATPYYISTGLRKKIENGEIIITGKENGIVKLEYSSGFKDESPKTIWNKTSHSASEQGTKMLMSILNGKRFTYPKSIYAVHDAIRLCVKDNPNALILDFFSGSGTTLHAVNLLNKEDGGHRRCIMVTNNEVSAEEEKAFRAKGLHKGDEEWEKYGIARYVNWPRTKCSILGVDVNGKPIQGDYITSNTEEKPLKRNIKQISLDLRDGSLGTKLKKQIVGLMADKKIPQNAVKAECPYLVLEGASNAILFDVTKIDEFMEEIHEDIDTIYVVTSNSKAFALVKKELEELPERTKAVPLTIPMADGFAANAAYYKLTFLDKDKVSLGTQLEKLLPILWMKAGAHGVCPTHVESEYSVYPENKMAILNDEFAIGELRTALHDHPSVETVYIIDDSEENYRALVASLHVRQTFQLYRDYLDNFKINIENKQ